LALGLVLSSAGLYHSGPGLNRLGSVGCSNSRPDFVPAQSQPIHYFDFVPAQSQPIHYFGFVPAQSKPIRYFDFVPAQSKPIRYFDFVPAQSRLIHYFGLLLLISSTIGTLILRLLLCPGFRTLVLKLSLPCVPISGLYLLSCVLDFFKGSCVLTLLSAAGTGYYFACRCNDISNFCVFCIALA
jgi:hypothetical protein